MRGSRCSAESRIVDGLFGGFRYALSALRPCGVCGLGYRRWSVWRISLSSIRPTALRSIRAWLSSVVCLADFAVLYPPYGPAEYPGLVIVGGLFGGFRYALSALRPCGVSGLGYRRWSVWRISLRSIRPTEYSGVSASRRADRAQRNPPQAAPTRLKPPRTPARHAAATCGRGGRIPRRWLSGRCRAAYAGCRGWRRACG